MIKNKYVELNSAWAGIAVVTQRIHDPIDARETRIKHDLAFASVRLAYSIDATQMYVYICILNYYFCRRQRIELSRLESVFEVNIYIYIQSGPGKRGNSK